METMDRKQMDMYPEYIMSPTQVFLKQKIGGLMNFIPYVGTFKRGAEFQGNTLGR